MDSSVGLYLSVLVTSLVAQICAGQDDRLFTIQPRVRTLKANSGWTDLFRCEFGNVTEAIGLAWTMNGLLIGNATYIFNPEYQDQFVLHSANGLGEIEARNLSLEFHLSNFSCRLYNHSVNSPSDGQDEPIHKSLAGTLRIPNKPETDPVCELALARSGTNIDHIELRCCVRQTREELILSLIQKTVVHGSNISRAIDDLSVNSRECFPHTVSEHALRDGSFQCSLESRLFGLKRTCAFLSFKPSINLSHFEPKRAYLSCEFEASDIIGYSWSADRHIKHRFSADQKHYYIDEVPTRSVVVSCTVFTSRGFGSSKLQINAPDKPGNNLQNRRQLILIAICMGAVICLLFMFILFYLIYKRGICFCFRAPERLTQSDLRRMQRERENMAHFQKFRSTHGANARGGVGGETVSFLMANGGAGHRYQSPLPEEGEDLPPVPGGGDKFNSHLLDYADLDHGNGHSSAIADDPAPPPQRPDNSKVEYADILKPPTKSLREMS